MKNWFNHLINGEPPVDIHDKLKYYDENGYINYMDYDSYLSMDQNINELRKNTKLIRIKKFICETPIGSTKDFVI